MLEALCAFVRNESQKNAGNDAPAPAKAEISQAALPQLASDIQAALTVIGRRKSVVDQVNLYGAHIPQAHLVDADLNRAYLVDADLYGANLIDANLSGAYLDRANLSLSGLWGADLGGANLSSANLSSANLSNALLYRANLSGANLDGANLSGVKYLTQAQLDGACGDETPSSIRR